MTSAEPYHESSGLTDSQKRVVNHNDGPMLVNGGPGSGKTHVIVERVARMVWDGIATPEQIFCMTFTKKAAGEMLQRLKKTQNDLIRKHGHEHPNISGRDLTDVRVGTIHSLGIDILKENSDITGITEETAIFDNMSKLAWCFKNAENLGIDQSIMRMNAAGCSKILKGINFVKREMLSPNVVREKINAKLSDNETAELNDTKRSELDASISGLYELLKVYDAHEEYMECNNLIDYEDMVGKAVKLLESNQTIRKKYTDIYVIVDEFQDNNRAQFRLATMLAGSGNIMVVGDRNQSIMEFQGAYISIFDDFASKYPDHTKIDLIKNHRCSKNIQDLANRLKSLDGQPDDSQVTDAPDEIGIDAITPQVLGLADSVSDKESNPSIVTTVAADDNTEREFVVHAIQHLMNAGTAQENIAVLCRTNAACRQFAKLLRTRGIFAAPGNSGISMEDPMVAEILALLHIAASPETSGMEIAMVLERRGITASNIQAINCASKKLSPNKQNDRCFEALRTYKQDEQQSEIAEIKRWLTDMHTNSTKKGLLATIHDIMLIHTDAYRLNANSDTYDAAKNRAILGRIYDMAKRYNHHYPFDTLLDFVEYAKFATSVMEADSGLLDSDPSADAASGVNVLTIHKSKGKEFGSVFVTGLYGTRHHAERSIIPEWILDHTSHNDITEQNLLYVAITRAKNRLFLSYPASIGVRAKETVPVFEMAQQMQSAHRIWLSQVGLTTQIEPDLVEGRILQIEEEACRAIRESRLEAAVGCLTKLWMLRRGKALDASAIPQVDANYIDDLQRPPSHPPPDIRNMSMSASKIMTYQKCPQQFKYQYVLSIPTKHAIYLEKGSIVHKALEEIGRGTRGVDDAIKDANNQLDKIRCSYADYDFLHVKPSIEIAIRNYIKWAESTEMPQRIDLEAKFATDIDGIKYSGKIDRIETFADGTYNIIDYKTGNSKITNRGIKQDYEDETIRQPQVCIYVHAAGEKYNHLPKKFKFVYVEQESRRDGCTIREYDITEESVKNGINIIKEQTNHIINGEFTATPDPQTCWQCAYKPICPDAV